VEPYRGTQAALADDAIRSIRVASTLIARFRAIVAQGTTSPDELAIKIGESQQIYPEIWRHLDDARLVLIARERDVAAYDRARRTELVHLGVTDVEITRELNINMFGRIRYSASKTVSFNLDGVERAHEAARALMGVMPEVDWPSLARAEDREIAAAGSMKTRKWINAAKLIAAAAVVAGIALAIQAIATSGKQAPAERAPPPQIDFYASARHTYVTLLEERIQRLRATHDLTCDPAIVPELAALLRADGQTTSARTIESACTRALPVCMQVQHDVIDQLIAKHALIRNRELDLVCHGIVIGSTHDAKPAFVVSITGRAKDGQHAYRGVLALDGTTLVAFEPSPLPIFVGAGDLDGDHFDELVWVDAGHLVVSRVAGDHFVDIAGPALPAGCQGTATIERDVAEDGKPVHETLAITVEDPHPRKGCPETGRHSYTLTGTTLGESD
jgi:hypothetical protein